MKLKYLGRRWRRISSSYLPHRELTLRTDGKVRFLKVSKKVQILGLLFVLIISGWGMFASVSYFIGEKVIEAKEMEILKNFN